MIAALTFATYAVTLDGAPVLPHARAIVERGRVLLPVRALGEALGADVGYDAQTHRITVQRGSRLAVLPAGGAVRIAGGHAYAPLRAAATAFGLNVTYLAASRTVALADLAAPRPASVPVARTIMPAPYAAAANAVAGATFAITTTPANSTFVHEPYPSISARFAGAGAIDRNALRVVLDGRDVTADVSVIGDSVLLTPRSALGQGRHDVAVTGRTTSGAPLSAGWSFTDTFAFSTAPPPTPFPVSAIYLDRYISPGTNAFDVIVRGAPGMFGYVGIDGVGSTFPLLVSTYDSYVAHVVIPNGVFQPNARVAARITLPDGRVETIVMPQTITLVTVTPTPYPVPTPSPTPRRRAPAPDVVPTPHTRVPLATPTPTPRPTAVPTPTPVPTPRPTPRPKRTAAPPPPDPAPTDSPSPSPTPHQRTPLTKPPQQPGNPIPQ